MLAGYCVHTIEEQARKIVQGNTQRHSEALTHSLGKVIQHDLPPSHINQTTPLQLFQYPPNNLNTCLCPMASSQASCSTPPLANIAAASPSPSPSAGANSRQILCGSSCLSRSGAYGALRSERWNFLPGREAVWVCWWEEGVGGERWRWPYSSRDSQRRFQSW
jgi:hypothetical protein